MTTYVTIGALSASYAAAAVAGAVGLGVAGLAIGRSLRRDRDHGGYGGQRGGYHRRRRSEKEESAALENLMELIREEDVTGCGKRLVCELAAADDQRLTVEELSILNLVGPAVKPGEGLLPKGATWEYRAARGFGQTSGDCGQAFPMCALNGTQLMDTVMAFLP
ncbi:uncharacterized protein [Panulirus ornatus]|uniref:uncharacterized protein n=1 Tax=Panulirus ornatus TaxID=150431 RepID=UPI003A890DE2